MCEIELQPERADWFLESHLHSPFQRVLLASLGTVDVLTCQWCTYWQEVA